MENALIGYTGFVGGNIFRQANPVFTDCFNSKNIGEIRGRSYDWLVCAGISAEMWTANQAPEQDRAKIQSLLDHLTTVQAKRCVLISTVDVFARPIGVNEDTVVELDGFSAYGQNRFAAEEFFRRQFPELTVMRLAGLFGQGMKKNLIYDLLNDNDPNAFTNPHSVFQFYDTSRLWSDIQIAQQHHLPLVHCTAEPISAHQIAQEVFGVDLVGTLTKPPRVYDFQTKWAELFGGQDNYFYDVAETVQRIKAFVTTYRLHSAA